MTQRSWPFYDAATGGTPVLEDQWSIMARSWASPGVVGIPGDQQLQVFADNSGREVHVRPGRACVRGHWYESDAQTNLTVAANAAGNTRIDTVVLRLDPSANSVVLAVKQGTAAATPTPPALTTTDTAVCELALAHITVTSGVSSLSAGAVSDQRQYAGQQVIPVLSARRPSAPWPGMRICELDTGRDWTWSGTAWIEAQDSTARAAAAAANANANARIPMNGDAVVSNFIIKTNPIQFMDSSGVVRYTVDQMTDSLGVNTRDANGWRSIPFTIKYADGVVRAHYAMEVGGTLTVSGGATFINGVTVHGAGLYLSGEFAKYVDGTLRFHVHNGGTSVYSDLGVTGSLISEGQMRLSDAGRPAEAYFGPDADRRWLLYRGDGIVRRLSDDGFRWMVGAIVSSSSQAQKSDIAAPSDTPDILGLTPRSFQWTDADAAKVGAYPGERYGLIAEEVAAVDERFVMRGQDGDVVGLDQHALIAALIAKVTELEQRINTLEETR